MPGYKVKTVEAPRKGLSCPHCHLLLKDAVQTTEGMRLCVSCQKAILGLPSKRCEDCGISVDSLGECFADAAVRREIKEVLVYCQYCELGCPWKGQLQHLKDHTKACSHRGVACPNEGCDVTLPKGEIAAHIDQCAFRAVECPHCGGKERVSKLEKHLQECSGVPVECGQCGLKVKRSNMPEHEDSSCKVEECVLCAEKVSRKSKIPISGESDKEHLSDPVEQFEHSQQLGRGLRKLARQVASLEQRGALSEETLQGLQESLRGVQEAVSRMIGQSTEDKARTDRKTPRYATISDVEELIAKSTQQQEHKPQASHAPTSNIVQEALEKRVTEVEKSNNLLNVRTAELELQLQASMASTHNGVFLWRIPDISRRKRDARDERITSIYSPPFYTGRNGYKMCIRCYLNGDGIGYKTHLSIFFVLMKGEYDPLLHWPFEHKVSLILVDQNHHKHIVQTFKATPDSSSFQRPRSDMNVASGCPKFAKLDVLDSRDYTKDDVMYIKCIVDTSHIFHP